MNELKTATEKIKDIAKECSQKNWDSYGAEPLTDIEAALEFAKRLHWSSWYLLRIAEIMPEPDGAIGFDWYDEDTKESGSISVAKDGTLIYSFKIAGETAYGTTKRSFIPLMLLKEKKWPEPEPEIFIDFNHEDYKECYKITKAHATKIKEWLEEGLIRRLRAKLYWFAARNNWDDPIKETDNDICLKIDDGKRGGKYVVIHIDSKTLKIYHHAGLKSKKPAPTLDARPYLNHAFFEKLKEAIEKCWNAPIEKD